jgi:hypothetical protein
VTLIRPLGERPVGGEHDSTLSIPALPLVFVRLVSVLSCLSIYTCHDEFVLVSYRHGRFDDVMWPGLLNITACQGNSWQWTRRPLACTCVHVCKYVRMCMYRPICSYECMDVILHAWVCWPTCVRTSECVYIYIWFWMCVYISMLYICVSTCECTYTYEVIFLCPYIHMCSCVYGRT